MHEIIIFFCIIFTISIFFLLDFKYRPVALLNLLIALILMPGSLLCQIFYEEKILIIQELQIAIILINLFLNIWMIFTRKVSQFFRNEILNYNHSNYDLVFINRFLFIFFSIAIFLTIREVGGVQNTGFWGIFFDPENYKSLRAATHKNIDNKLVKSIYSYAIIFAPFFFISNLTLLKDGKNKFECLISIILIIFTTLLSGQRANLMYLFFGYFLFLMLGTKKIQIVKYINFFLIFLLVAVIISGLRSGGIPDFDIFLAKLTQVLNRIFLSPFYTGVIHLDFVNQYGLWELIDVITLPGKIFLGIEHVNHFQIVGQWHSDYEFQHTNTSEIFFAMTVFGIFFGGVFSVIVILILDLISQLSCYLLKPVRLPLLVSFQIFFLSIISTKGIYQIIKSLTLILILSFLLLIRYFFVSFGKVEINKKIKI